MRRMVCILILCLLLPLEAGAADRSPDAIVGTVESLQQATNDYGCTTQEMPLCDTVADAMRASGGTDAAILNGGDLVRNLDGGEVTWETLRSLFSEEKNLAVTRITGAELKDLLEIGVSHATVAMPEEVLDIEQSSFDGFPQVSGFTFRYDPTAPVGDRVTEICLPDGTALDSQADLTLTATGYMLSGGYGYPALDYEALEVTQAQALADYFSNGVLSSPETGRITCIGLGNRFFISRPAVLLVSLALILIVLSVQGVLRKAGPKDRSLYFDDP